MANKSRSRSSGSFWSSNRARPVESVKPRFHQSAWAQVFLAFWRWLPELVVLSGLVFVFIYVVRSQDLPTYAAACVVVMPITLLLVIPKVGPALRAVLWVDVTRHRLRSFMAENGIRNRTGRLPWLLFIWPTKVGERAWMVLVAGIDIGDIESRLGSLGSTCWAREGRVVAHKQWSHLIRIDIVRRDLLAGKQPVANKLIPKGTELELLPPTDAQTEARFGDNVPSQWAIEAGLSLNKAQASTQTGMRAPSASSSASGKSAPVGNSSDDRKKNGAVDEVVVISKNGEDVSDYV